MITTPRALLALSLALAVPRVTAARTYTLQEVLELARRSNPGVAANAQQTAGVQAQLMEANRSYLPTGDLLSLVAPVPDIHCELTAEEKAMMPPGTDPKTYRQDNCLRTNISEASLKFKGIFTRTEVRLIQPVYTFGKITAGVNAAQAGIAASRSNEEGKAADLDLNVRRAYWGAKLSREILETIDDGMTYITQAQKRIEDDLTSGKGNATIADRLRLQVMKADVDARVLEARKLGQISKSGLRALIGPEAPGDLDVDAEPLEQVNVTIRPLSQYEEQARLSRPEVRALDHLVASKRALAELEKRKQYPDLVLMGTATFAYANSIDNPQNAFYNDPFNTLSAGLAAALRMPLDIGVRNARAAKLRAEAEEAFHRQREALGGIAFEVERAYADLVEAVERSRVLEAGAKSGKRWITVVYQNFSAGLAETKDFSDALVQYFTFRVRALQAVFDVNVAAATLGRAVGSDVTR
jgi:outer membrane protein TolC